MQLLADENVPKPIVKRLRSDGFVVRAVIEGNAGADDVDVLHMAATSGWLLITQDNDFGILVVKLGLAIEGVLLLELAKLPLTLQCERLSVCLASGTETFRGKFTVIEPARMRSRALVQASR